MVDRPARGVARLYGQAGRSVSWPVSANPPAECFKLTRKSSSSFVVACRDRKISILRGRLYPPHLRGPI
ncbi:hypothetical protein GFL21_33365 [Rhizobium anhuiense]|nr:hypothetical protein [Rhizobium anhuiense]